MKLIKEHGPALVLVIALVMAATPGMIRAASDNPVLVGSESYFNLRMGHALEENILLEYDDLQERTHHVDIYQYLVFAMLKLSSNDQSLLMSSVFLCLLSAFLFYSALIKLGIRKDRAFVAFLVYVFSPIYLYAATTLNSHSLTLFLLALSMYIYSSAIYYHRPYLSAASLIPAVLTVVTQPAAFILFILVLMIHSSYSDRSFAYPIIGLVLGVVVAGIVRLLTGSFPQIIMSGGIALKHYVTDFGATLGYPFFQLLLALVAISLYWKWGIGTKLMGIFMIGIVIASAFFPGLRLFASILLCVYTAFAIGFFVEREWVVLVLRDLTLLIIFSSLLFSSVSFATRIASMEPTFETIAVMELMIPDKRRGPVMSSQENGYLIEYYVGKRAFVDEKSSQEELEEAQAILNSGSPSRTHSLLNDNEIDFIYIDPQMKATIWDKKTGLLLVLDLSENFINLGQFEGREAWLYLRI